MTKSLIGDRDFLGERAYHYQTLARNGTRFSARVSEYANRLKEENERLRAENLINQIDPEILSDLRKNFKNDPWTQKVREMDEELKNISIPIHENEISFEEPMSDPSTGPSTGVPNYSPLTTLQFSPSSESPGTTSLSTDPKTEKYNWSGTDTTVKPRKNRKQPK